VRDHVGDPGHIFVGGITWVSNNLVATLIINGGVYNAVISALSPVAWPKHIYLPGYTSCNTCEWLHRLWSYDRIVRYKRYKYEYYYYWIANKRFDKGYDTIRYIYVRSKTDDMESKDKLLC